MQSNLNLINGRFITLDDNGSSIDSVTIKNGKIQKFNNPDVSFQTIDLNNNIVIPGFIDSHFHLKNYGKRQDMINLKRVNSINQIATLVHEKINNNPDIKWIEGFGWDHNLWEGQYPDADILNSLSRTHSIVLTRIDGHSMWVNNIAISKDIPSSISSLSSYQDDFL